MTPNCYLQLLVHLQGLGDWAYGAVCVRFAAWLGWHLCGIELVGCYLLRLLCMHQVPCMHAAAPTAICFIC
jgi:hypothetical protein